MLAFCSAVQKSHWLFGVGCIDWEWISKLESVLQAKRKKIKFYVLLANEETGANTFNSL